MGSRKLSHSKAFPLSESKDKYQWATFFHRVLAVLDAHSCINFLICQSWDLGSLGSSQVHEWESFWKLQEGQFCTRLQFDERQHLIYLILWNSSISWYLQSFSTGFSSADLWKSHPSCWLWQWNLSLELAFMRTWSHQSWIMLQIPPKMLLLWGTTGSLECDSLNNIVIFMDTLDSSPEVEHFKVILLT